jgi:hypothetical protein
MYSASPMGIWEDSVLGAGAGAADVPQAAIATTLAVIRRLEGRLI